MQNKFVDLVVDLGHACFCDLTLNGVSRLGLRGAPAAQAVEPQSEAPTEAPAPQAIQREPPRPLCATHDEAIAWAAEWHSQYEARAHDASLYHDVDELLTQLEPGADGSPPPVRLVKLSFLEEWARTRPGVPLPRRQLLERDHPEGFLSAAEVQALPRDYGGGDTALRLVPISHGWLTPQHPDPRGEQLARF
eukprot:1829327-Prymnesium_polylepis.1